MSGKMIRFGAGTFDIEGLKVSGVACRMKASTGEEFKVHMDENGLRIYTEETSAGNSTGNPVLLSVDQLWEIASGPDGNPRLGDRAEVKRSRKRGRANEG